MVASHIPLSALRVFEAAARHLNFSRAAEELHLTHGAVSHRVRLLEESLGVALFRRQSRGVLLTEEGQKLAGAVRDALGRLTRAVEEVRRGSRPEELTISVLPAFATYWLIPRIADFNRRHPEIEVNIRATQAVADFVREGVDLAVRYGPGGWQGLYVEKLLDEEVFPVCSPRFRDGNLPRTPAELAEVTLLRSPRQPWGDWFRVVGLDLEEPARGPRYEESSLVIQAAVAGQGVALARRALVQPELDSGKLVRLFALSAPERLAYYIVHPLMERVPEKVAVFCAWLREQVASQPVAGGEA